MPVRKCAIIVAGGSGTRAGGDVPKQFQMLCGRPVVWWSLRAFSLEDSQCRIILVLNKDFIGLWDELYSKLYPDERYDISVVTGGETRCHSVRNGLAALPEDFDGLVAVHDAARPLADVALIRRGWDKAVAAGAAVPVVPMVDSMRRLVDGGSVSVPRKDYVAVQTPQVFDARLLRLAYSADSYDGFTDDASLVEATGRSVSLYQGSPVNFKITGPGDLARAEIALSGMK